MIPPEKLTKILKFSRLDNSRAADTGGAGLGLSIAKEIVWFMGELLMWKVSMKPLILLSRYRFNFNINDLSKIYADPYDFLGISLLNLKTKVFSI